MLSGSPLAAWRGVSRTDRSPPGRKRHRKYTVGDLVNQGKRHRFCLPFREVIAAAALVGRSSVGTGRGRWYDRTTAPPPPAQIVFGGSGIGPASYNMTLRSAGCLGGLYDDGVQCSLPGRKGR